MAKFSTSEWNKIESLADTKAEKFGLPKRRNKSVVLATFNIRKLGKKKKRSSQAWKFLVRACSRFDLLAIQEVMDDLEGLRHLRKELGGDKIGLVVSDMTGVLPGETGNAERLAFLYRRSRIQRTELASDITYDRTKVVRTSFENRAPLQRAWENHIEDIGAWEEKARIAKEAGKKKPRKPSIVLPTFLTFIRQPHCASFEITPRSNAKPIEFLLVNAHLLYGTNKEERRWEFEALIDWLTIRAKQRERTYVDNLVMMGDCNLEFESIGKKRQEIDADLKRLNETVLAGKKAAKVNFPLLTGHPEHGELKTNARQSQTYDQIAIFAHDKRLPTPEDNKKAGTQGADGYDYGVFRLTDLFAQALHGRDFGDLTKSQQERILSRCGHDVSDHMPAWFRLPIPGA